MKGSKSIKINEFPLYLDSHFLAFLNQA